MMPKKFLVMWCDNFETHLFVGELPKDVTEACDDGECEIIDISDPDHPLQLTTVGWWPIDTTEA